MTGSWKGDADCVVGSCGLVVCPPVVWGSVIAEETVNHFPCFIRSYISVTAEYIVCANVWKAPRCIGVYYDVFVGWLGCGSGRGLSGVEERKVER